MPTYLKLLLFSCLFFGLNWHIAHIGGWVSLTKTFRRHHSAKGKRFYLVSGSIIDTNNESSLRFLYNGCLFVSVSDEGVFLSVWVIQRFMHPPLFIPWTQIRSVDERNFGASSLIQLDSQFPAINVRGKAGQYILKAYKNHSNPSFKRDA